MTNKKLKQLIVSLAVIIPLLGTFGTIYILDLTSPIQPIEQPEEEKTTYEIHKEIEDAKKPPQETVEKTWTNGNVTINYVVRVENGIEASPPPSVLQAIEAAITEKDKAKFLEEYYNSDFYKIRHQYDEAIKQHNPAYIQSYIDQGFSCETYHELAYKYKMDKMYDENGKYVDAENYIYQRAYNECIDPKHQEEIDKVNAELEEVN